MVKMADVAERAGVSIKTVSRVLNNEPHVQDALRERVKQAANDLGYVPSLSARSLRSNRSYTILLITHTHNSGYVNSIQAGALQACQDQGYLLTVSLIQANDPHTSVVERLEMTLRTSKPDGVILVAPFVDNADIDACLQKHRLAVARIGPNSIAPASLCVKIDERQAAHDLTTHLIDLGHRRIAFIRGKEDQNATQERFAGFSEAMKAAGINIQDDFVRSGDFTFSSGQRAAEALFGLDHIPTAIFASNDDMAAGVTVMAQREGLSVPGDISVVGFDDSEIASKTWPPLTTVRQPIFDYGNVATQALISAVATSAEDAAVDGLATTLSHVIIHRESVGPAPKEGSA